MNKQRDELETCELTSRDTRLQNVANQLASRSLLETDTRAVAAPLTSRQLFPFPRVKKHVFIRRVLLRLVVLLKYIQVQAKRLGWAVTAQIKAELPDPFNDAILLTGCEANEGSRCQPSPDEKPLKSAAAGSATVHSPESS